MKTQSLAAAIVLFSIITGCNKLAAVHPTNGNNSLNGSNSTGLVSKWQIVNDSTANSMVRVSALTSNYVGVTGDYFDFRTDGFCYTKEGNIYDTLAYQLVSPQSIVIQKFGLNINGVTEASNLTQTGTTATITTQNMLTPGGTFFRVVNLKK
jgi:hypothetical protein